MGIDDRLVGLTREESVKVTDSNTAAQVGSGLLPVFATPAMTALMEKAAASLLEEHLPVGETTVGISLNIAHTSATPVGLTVRAVAEITAVEGKKISFKVTAFDDAGEIGSGTHERFMVNAEKFMSKAAKKTEK